MASSRVRARPPMAVVSRRDAGDLALAALVTALVLGEAIATGAAPAVVALAGLTGACLAVRRRWPLSAYVVGSLALLLLSALHAGAGLYALPNVIGLYSVGAHCRRTPALVGLALGLAAVVGYWAVVPSADAPWLPSLSVAAWALAWVAGQTEQQRRRAAADAAEAAREAERRRAAEQAAAVASERARIAREVHDVVGHALTVMVLHAGAARATHARDPVASAASLATVEDVGRTALGDLDHALELVDGPAPRTPAVGTAGLDRLIDQFRATGMTIEFVVSGEPRRLPAAVDLALYRVAQESLTNAAKHAPGATAHVGLHYGRERVVVHVTDSGVAAAAASGTRRGLAGLAERARSLGGTVVAGPRDGGGWEVRCELPTPS